VKARQRPGRAGRVGDGKPRRQAEFFFEPVRQIGNEPFLATEQMRGAFDVEEKTIGAIRLPPGRGGRRIARRPQRQTAQRSLIGGGLDDARLQLARFRARVGQRLAKREPCGLCSLVQGGDARPSGSGNSKDERPVRRDGFLRRMFRLRHEKTQDWPARQPD